MHRVYRKGGCNSSKFRHDLLDGHEPVRIPVHKRAEQHAIEYAENSSVGADTEAERQDGSYRKSGVFGEGSNSVPDIAPHCRHTVSPCYLRRLKEVSVF